MSAPLDGDAKHRLRVAEAREARFRALRAEVGARLPEAFPPNGAERRPLAIGAQAALAPLLEGWSGPTLRSFLEEWCRRPRYLAALAAPGARRINLDGTDAGPVSDGHRAYAEKLLAERERAKRAAEKQRAKQAAEKRKGAG